MASHFLDEMLDFTRNISRSRSCARIMQKYGNDLRDDSFCFGAVACRAANDIYICMREFLFVFTKANSLRLFPANVKFYSGVYAVWKN